MLYFLTTYLKFEQNWVITEFQESHLFKLFFHEIHSDYVFFLGPCGMLGRFRFIQGSIQGSVQGSVCFNGRPEKVKEFIEIIKLV